MRTCILCCIVALVGCVTDQPKIDTAACDAAYRAVVPSPLPSNEDLLAKGPEYASAFVDRVVQAGHRLHECYNLARLQQEREDGTVAVGLAALRSAGESLQATGSSMTSEPTPALSPPPAPPLPTPVDQGWYADQIIKRAQNPPSPPWCRPDSPYAHSSACP